MHSRVRKADAAHPITQATRDKTGERVHAARGTVRRIMRERFRGRRFCMVSRDAGMLAFACEAPSSHARLFSSDGQSGRLVSGRSSVRSRQEARRVPKGRILARALRLGDFSAVASYQCLTWVSRLGAFPPDYGVLDHRAGASPNQLLSSGGGNFPFSPAPFFFSGRASVPGR